MILQLKLFRLNYRFESDKQMAQTMIIEFVFYKIHISEQQITDDYLLTKATYYSVILLKVL